MMYHNKFVEEVLALYRRQLKTAEDACNDCSADEVELRDDYKKTIALFKHIIKSVEDFKGM